jgi:hypothetical protein
MISMMQAIISLILFAFAPIADETICNRHSFEDVLVTLCDRDDYKLLIFIAYITIICFFNSLTLSFVSCKLTL